jgi:hypothetical protein
MTVTMAKKRKETDPPSGRRADVKYVAIPLELWRKLKELADRDERSVSWVARRAVKEFLSQRELE